MKRFAMYRSIGIALFAMLAASSLGFAQERAVPAPAVITAWENAGAEFGWISLDPNDDDSWRFDVEKPFSGGLPAFRFRVFPSGALKSLAPPEVPFGLWLEKNLLSAADLKEIAGLKQLQALNLDSTFITDA